MTQSVLIVEDSDGKFLDVALVVAGHFGDQVPVIRAATVVEAEGLSANGDWCLVILDISMDIVSSASGRTQNGHASTGGMAILERMYLLGREVPTVIVTAFDAFRTGASPRENDGILGLEDISRKAREFIGDKFLGAVRYGGEDWQSKLKSLLTGVTTP